jgi:YVTN family beta-propeller protein
MKSGIRAFIMGMGALCAVIRGPSAQPNATQVVPPSLIFELLALNGDLETAAKPKYRSPAVVIPSPDKTTLYVAEQTAKRIAVITVASNAVTREILLPNEPTGLAISANGATLYATCSSERWPAGMVCAINTSVGTVTKRFAVGHSARAPVISPDGNTLYVCNWFDNNVSVINLSSGAQTTVIPVTREPYAAAITPDGKTLVVTNSLPDQKATDTAAIACKITLINTETQSITASIPLPVGSHSLFGVCVSPDGKYAFATHLIGRFTIPAIKITQGWIHSNNLAIVNIAARTLVNDVELDDASDGASNPWGLACTADGGFLCVLHAGSNEMSMINLPQMLTKVVGAANLSHDFTALQGMKELIRLNTASPRALAIIDNKAYVAGYFSDALDVVDISSTVSNPRVALSLGTAKPFTTERQGERNFCDASICMQNWQSCFSCHPFTRPDALNWILGSDNNTSKNVKSMLHSFQTPPTSWAGKRTGAGGPNGSVRMGIANELFTEPNEQVAVPLDTFLMRLKPVPSPKLVKGRLSASAQRGKTLYESNRVDCNYCHARPLFTDKKFHNTGVPDPYDANTEWDTPSIIEAWRTGPYGHLGSYDKLDELLKMSGHSFDARNLSAQDFADLMEYVLSL